jgi:hypothetical protein
MEQVWTDGQVLDSAFRDAVLMVCIDTTEGDSLVGGINGVPELTRSEYTVIAMVMFNGDMVPVGKVLKGGLGLESVVGTDGLLGVDVVKPGGVVHKDSGDKVTHLL